MDVLIALGSITILDLILSGDNAVIIALASHRLPPQQRKKAVIFGSMAAVLMRVLLTVVATLLLQIPYVQFIGGLALAYIAVHLLADNSQEVSCKEANCLFDAIKIIIAADAIMSLDNVLAIAGVANGHLGLLLAGLAISIPFVVFGSQFLMKLMDSFPIITYIGSAVLGWTSAKMIVADRVIGVIFQPFAFYLEVALAVTVVAIGWYLQHRSKQDKKVTVNDSTI